MHELVEQLCATLDTGRYLKIEDQRLLDALRKWQRTKQFWATLPEGHDGATAGALGLTEGTKQ